MLCLSTSNKFYHLYFSLCGVITYHKISVGGGCRPPRAPMGPEPLSLSGERAEGARRADRGEHTGGLPRFGPRWTRKTLLLLGCIELGSSGAWRASYTGRMGDLDSESLNPLYVAHGPPFIAQRGHRQVST